MQEGKDEEGKDKSTVRGEEVFTGVGPQPFLIHSRDLYAFRNRTLFHAACAFILYPTRYQHQRNVLKRSTKRRQ